MAVIKDITFEVKKYKYKKPFHIANLITETVENVEVTLKTDSGYTGKGEISPSFRVNAELPRQVYAVENDIKKNLIGLNTRNWRKIFDITDKTILFPGLKAAIQFSVLDALSEELNCGVWEILGGARDHIETDKTVSIGSVKEMVKDAVSIHKEGFNVIKIKVGEDVYKDIEAVYEINRKVKNAKYIVDANMAYRPKEAVYFAKKLYSLGVDIAIFEQPVLSDDVDGLKFVRYSSNFPVCADESARTKYRVLRLIKNDAVDFVNIKLGKSGISDAISIVEICKTNNTGLMIGCYAESSIGINQSVQFACGFGVFKYHDLDSHLILNEKKYRGKFIQKKNQIFVK